MSALLPASDSMIASNSRVDFLHAGARPHPRGDRRRRRLDLVCALHAARAAPAGGWISVARYMQLALPQPAIGYYASGARKFGPQGDFVTAPELGSLFGRT